MRNEILTGLATESPEAQLAWFRERPDLKMTLDEWDAFYCVSIAHRGQCCSSCLDDFAHGYGDDIRGCCCKAIRTGRPPRRRDE